MVGEVRALAVLSALAAALWLMAGAQMIVTSPDHAGAVYGVWVAFVGLALAVLCAWLMNRTAPRVTLDPKLMASYRKREVWRGLDDPK